MNINYNSNDCILGNNSCYEYIFIKKTCENYNDIKTNIAFYNRFHYGDHLFNLKFFYNISQHLLDNNIMIDYYYDQHYNSSINELEKYVNPKTVTLHSLFNKPNNAHEIWMGINLDGHNYLNFDEYFNSFYKNILSILNIQHLSISTSLFQPEPYLETIYNNLSDCYKNIDILIINCEPKSGQIIYNKKYFNDMCIRLSNTYKIVTTDPVSKSITCTRDENLTMQDIGAISTHAKYVIAIFSGPLTTCFNEASEKYVKKWILFHSEPVIITNFSNIIVLHNTNELDLIEKYLL